MPSVSFHTFRKAIRTNPRAVLVPSKTSVGAMVYLYLPKHEDSDSRGLWEICAVASPSVFSALPKNDFITEKSREWVRGYNSFFRKCRRLIDPSTKRPVFDKKKIVGIIPQAYDRIRARELKDAWLDSRVSSEEKLSRKIPWRKIKGSGDPVGGLRETDTVYNFGD